MEQIDFENPDPPTSKDIRDIARYQVTQSEPMPAGRKIDVVIPRYKGTGRPKGFYPQDEQTEEPENIEPKIVGEEEEEIIDPFAESRRVSFNNKRFKAHLLK